MKLAFSNTCMHGDSVMSGICNKLLIVVYFIVLHYINIDF